MGLATSPNKARMSVFKWIAIVPALAELVGEAVQALQDGRLDDDEVKSLGGKLVAIVAAVV